MGTVRAGPVRLVVHERTVSVLSELESVRAREGNSATFECTVSEVDTARSWTLGGRPLRPGGRVRIRQEGKKHILVLSELRPEDSGEVRFQAGPAQSAAQLEVEDVPPSPAREVSPGRQAGRAGGDRVPLWRPRVLVEGRP